MAAHTVTVELYYSGAWHTAPAYVQDPVTISHGAGSETSTAGPSTATVTLDDRTQQYDPTNPLGDLYGLIGRGTPARVTVDGTVRLSGEIVSWRPRRSLGFDPATGRGGATVEIDIAGLRRRLDQAGTPLASAMWRRIAASSPAAWWPLETGDQRETLTSPSALGGPALVAQPASAGTHRRSGVVGGSVTGPAGALAATEVSGGGQLAAPVSVPATATTWRLELAYMYTEATGEFASGQIVRIPFGNSLVGVFAGAAAAAELTIELSDADTFVSASTGLITDDGAWHLLTLDISSAAAGASTGYVLAIDGQTALSGTATGVVYGTPTQLVLSPTGDVGAVAHAVFWHGASVPADTGYGAFTGWADEPAAERVDALCTEEGITLTVSGDSADTTPVGPQRPLTLAELLAECATADGGILLDDPAAPGLTYRTRVDLYNQTSALTLDYTGRQIAPPLDVDLDDQAVTNDVTVSRPGGGSHRATLDTGPMSVADPPDGAGRHATQTEVNAAADGQLADLAGWRLHLGTWGEPRWPRITVDLDAAPALAATVAALTVGDVITLTGRTPGDVTLMVIGWSEVCGSHRRTIALVCAPAGPWTVATADGEPRVPADGSTLAADITAGALALSLASTAANGLWTVDPADFPLDLSIGAERVTVSAISGSSSPQTATVSARAVNGVARAWPAGTPVDVWLPAIAPL